MKPRKVSVIIDVAKPSVHVNSKSYDIMRPIDESYQKRLAQQVIFAPELGKWNYLVKPAN